MPLLLLAAIAVWFWMSQAEQAGTLTTPVAGAPPTRTMQTATETPGVVGLPGLATPWAVAGLEPPATAPATVAGPIEPISLLGPPPGSQFGVDDVVSFYWRWPGELEDGQRFAVYVLAGSNRVALGEIDEANLGQVYHLAAPLGESVGETGGFQWFVVLEDAIGGTTMGQSKLRPLGIVGR